MPKAMGAKRMAGGHRWAFKARFRAKAYGWRGSATAIQRLKEAVAEIKKVAKANPLTAGEGAVSLMERLWPALEDIDTSSGALGRAVNVTLEALIPILITAPAMPKVRAAWLERLYQAVLDDGVQYLSPVEERWGEIAVYPELMNAYADDLLSLLRQAWADDRPGAHVIGRMIGLSCLLEVGRYDTLLEVLRLPGARFWSDQRFGAEALARQGLYDAALAYADRCRDQYDTRSIDRFCEDVLLRARRADDAYRTYGLRTGTGTTYLAIYRDTVRRYPGRDARQVLLDLIEARGERGKWFAAAKDAGILDVALDCARAPEADPATLVRAARDFALKNTAFSASVALLALWGLVNGSGYDPAPGLVAEAFGHLMVGAARLETTPWALEEVGKLTSGRCSLSREHMQQTLSRLLEETQACQGAP